MEFTSQQIGDVELRFLNGKLDEVALMKNGECLVHLEHVAGGHVFLSVGDVRLNIYSMAGIRVELEGREMPVKSRTKK